MSKTECYVTGENTDYIDKTFFFFLRILIFHTLFSFLYAAGGIRNTSLYIIVNVTEICHKINKQINK